ncbi:hypothetical protein DFA_04447 [Cavenderia fasciculata]|uniref:Uncharacterized protein n=1 Tax=Cavenderia fasciculata TaxID=261658 RepID=F4PPL6_CACFS|nr:uncharacterized protein DFA_04447 [Cavenderia fasciculata]EGG22329.1 hypothetical protein DFA_04447 [Cavenderia fasciculata]|eukprot:XP_004360180.1 hypothetical protein DFA_04447 [Cavenderia fasciculata]
MEYIYYLFNLFKFFTVTEKVMHEMTLIELIVLTHISYPKDVVYDMVGPIHFKRKLRLNLVSKQWFEWVSEWLSTNCTMIASSGNVVNRILHTDMGKDKIKLERLHLKYPPPPILVWRNVKHLRLDILICFSQSSDTNETLQSFIKSVDTFEIDDYNTCLQDIIDSFKDANLIQTLKERSKLPGKQPIRLLNLMEIQSAKDILSKHDISPLFQPSSILIKFGFPHLDAMKWQDLMYIMSRSTVTKITFNYCTYLDTEVETAGLIQNVVLHYNNNRNRNSNNTGSCTTYTTPFASVTSLHIGPIKTNQQQLSLWLTPSIFPSLQSLSVQVRNTETLAAIVDQSKQFSRLESFESHFNVFIGDTVERIGSLLTENLDKKPDYQDIEQSCLESIGVKTLKLGRTGYSINNRLDLSNNTIIDTVELKNVLQSGYPFEVPQFNYKLPPNLKELVLDHCHLCELNHMMRNYNGHQDLIIKIIGLAPVMVLQQDDFDWIQHKAEIREVVFLGGNAFQNKENIDEQSTTMILDQLYHRHLNNIKPIEMILGIEIVNSKITPILSTIYHATRHTLQGSINFKSKLRLNLVSKLWFEWVGEWLSNRMMITSVNDIKRMTLPPPLIQHILHTEIGKRYLNDIILTDAFTSLYDKDQGYVSSAQPPKVPPRILVWRNIKHLILFDSSVLVNMMSKSPEIVDATKSFIKSLDVLDIDDPTNSLKDTINSFKKANLIQTLQDRAGMNGKHPIRLLNLIDIRSAKDILSPPDISPLFQPTSIVFSFKQDDNNGQEMKWEDLQFIMSRLTVNKIDINYYTDKGVANRISNLIQNVVSHSYNIGLTTPSPFTSITRINFFSFQTSEMISSWLTPSIFPSLQSLVIRIKDSKILETIIQQINQFPRVLDSFENYLNLPDDQDIDQSCLEGIRVKALKFGRSGYSVNDKLDLSNNTTIDTIQLQNVIEYQIYIPNFDYLLPRNLKRLTMIKGQCGQLNGLMKGHHGGDQDLTIRIVSPLHTKILQQDDFDWIQHKTEIRELNFVLGDDGMDEKLTIIILNQLYLRHLNNIKPIELITGINIIGSKITPILSTIYLATRHTLQAKY